MRSAVAQSMSAEQRADSPRYGALAIAHVCHEANRALQIIQGDPTIVVSPA